MSSDVVEHRFGSRENHDFHLNHPLKSCATSGQALKFSENQLFLFLLFVLAVKMIRIVLLLHRVVMRVSWHKEITAFGWAQ